MRRALASLTIPTSRYLFIIYTQFPFKIEQTNIQKRIDEYEENIYKKQFKYNPHSQSPNELQRKQ